MRYSNLLTVFLFVLLNLFQSAIGNTLVICRYEGLQSKIDISEHHESHNHAHENGHHHEEEESYGYENADDCNPCDDLYIENLSNTPNVRIYNYLPNCIANSIYKDIFQSVYPLKNHFDKSDVAFKNISFFFPQSTVLLI